MPIEDSLQLLSQIRKQTLKLLSTPGFHKIDEVTWVEQLPLLRQSLSTRFFPKYCSTTNIPDWSPPAHLNIEHFLYEIMRKTCDRAQKPSGIELHLPTTSACAYKVAIKRYNFTRNTWKLPHYKNHSYTTHFKVAYVSVVYFSTAI